MFLIDKNMEDRTVLYLHERLELKCVWKESAPSFSLFLNGNANSWNKNNSNLPFLKYFYMYMQLEHVIIRRKIPSLCLLFSPMSYIEKV